MSLEILKSQALEVSRLAVEADHNKRLSKAFHYYKKAICLFMKIRIRKLYSDENDDRASSMFSNSLKKYLNRVEDISRVLTENKENQSPILSENEEPEHFTPDFKANSAKPSKAELKDSQGLRKCSLTWDEIAGLENVKHVLQETIRVKARLCSQFKTNQNFWQSVLLYGPSCTGKSLLVQALCCEMNAYYLSFKEWQSAAGLEDRPERVLEELLEAAQKFVPAVVYIEEIHLVLPAEYGEELSRAKFEFLKLVEVSQNCPEVMVLASSTCPWELDPGARRRFSRRVYVPLPDSLTRREMLRDLIADALVEPSHVENLAKLTEGFSSNDLKRLAETAKSSSSSSGSEPSGSKPRAASPKSLYKALKAIRPSLSLASLTRYQHFTELHGNDQ